MYFVLWEENRCLEGTTSWVLSVLEMGARGVRICSRKFKEEAAWLHKTCEEQGVETADDAKVLCRATRYPRQALALGFVRNPCTNCEETDFRSSVYFAVATEHEAGWAGLALPSVLELLQSALVHARQGAAAPPVRAPADEELGVEIGAAARAASNFAGVSECF